jgi:serine-type D-Ala-D-Ala carboxypeptidase (penicillin-binding protein 5/6)
MALTVALSLALALAPSPSAAMRPLELPMPPPTAFPVSAPPAIDAISWMAWSVATDAEIGSLNPDRQHPQASITKLLTAILTVENADMSDAVTIDSIAGTTPIGYIGQPAVQTGEVWTVQQLLDDIMVQSDNRAAVALAGHVAGSVDAFVDLMNGRAAEIGMTNTVFANPHGLDAPGQVSTARDLIRLGVEALRHPGVMDSARITRITFALANRTLTVTATNRDVGIYPGFTGLKTGDTANAGQVLLSYTHTARGGIVAVVLGSTNRRAATRQLVAWATEALGPRDYFLAPAVDTDLEESFPAWYRTRLRAAGPLAAGGAGGRSPLTEDVTARLRELLPSLLGGSP